MTIFVVSFYVLIFYFLPSLSYYVSDRKIPSLLTCYPLFSLQSILWLVYETPVYKMTIANNRSYLTRYLSEGQNHIPSTTLLFEDTFCLENLRVKDEQRGHQYNRRSLLHPCIFLLSTFSGR